MYFRFMELQNRNTPPTEKCVFSCHVIDQISIINQKCWIYIVFCTIFASRRPREHPRTLILYWFLYYFWTTTYRPDIHHKPEMLILYWFLYYFCIPETSRTPADTREHPRRDPKWLFGANSNMEGTKPWKAPIETTFLPAGPVACWVWNLVSIYIDIYIYVYVCWD